MTQRQSFSDPAVTVTGEIVQVSPGQRSLAPEAQPGRDVSRLVRTQPAAIVPDLEYEPRTGSRLGRRFALWFSFFLFVLAPTIASVVYFAFIASDQYAAEMRFVVRLGPQQESSSNSALSTLVTAMAGNAASVSAGSTEDAYIVASYIHSRAILDDVVKAVNLQDIFSRPEADFYARLKPNATSEEVEDYWAKMVSTYIDSQSGIVTVKVRAFRPEDAVLLATTIGMLSEKLVNEIALRARQDALRRATDEVSRAQNLVYASLSEMERFRNTQGMIDPVQAATDTGKLLVAVLGEELAVENQVFVARRSLSPDSPSVRNLQSKLDGLKRQSAALRQQIAGNKSTSGSNVASAIAKYEELAVKQKLSESLYTLAENGLDRARRTAESQSVYLTMFVKPGLPEEYSYPKRFVFPSVIAVSCLILWSIGALIAASIEDHRI